MPVFRSLILIACCLMLAAFTPVIASTSSDAWQNEATQYYNNGDYKSAYKKYLKLGKKGDAFSSYRVSYMYLKGQGTKNDIVESLAWAVLAAQDGNEDLVSYRDAVAALVPENKRDKALSKADYYVRRWGKKETKRERDTSQGCTSSRIKSSCGDSSSSKSVWIAWPREQLAETEIQETIESLNAQIAAGSGMDTATDDS